MGKTSVMTVWLLARAFAAEEAARKLPRRLIYVVDRRVVVDQATSEAGKLRQLVENIPPFKQRLGLGDRSLPISTLRGQRVDNQEWRNNPASPAIVVGTVDMIGSRLLFSGYGVSPKMRPYHAGLLGANTLVVLDEAHLVPPFEALLESIDGGERDSGRGWIPFQASCRAFGCFPSRPRDESVQATSFGSMPRTASTPL
jgi:CRISPR-associated endonuclease/helicase Cas3